jgi:hypothetical protein
MAYARQPTLDENCPAQTRMMIAVTLCHSKEDPGPWRGQSKCTASAVPAPCGNFEDVQHCRAKADPMRVVAGVAVAGPVIAAAEAASGNVDGRGGCYVMLKRGVKILNPPRPFGLEPGDNLSNKDTSNYTK